MDNVDSYSAKSKQQMASQYATHFYECGVVSLKRERRKHFHVSLFKKLEKLSLLFELSSLHISEWASEHIFMITVHIGNVIRMRINHNSSVAKQ